MYVFVSSTYEDLKEYRKAVRMAIMELGHTPIMMEDFSPTGNPPKHVCFKQISRCSAFIGIYAYRYGYVPTNDQFSITEQEYHYAFKKIHKKNIMCFVVDEKVKWPEEYKENDNSLIEFKKKILKNRTVKFFESLDELQRQVRSAIVLIIPPDETIEEILETTRKTISYVSENKKLNKIYDLIVKNANNQLNYDALRITTKLISSDFHACELSTPSQFLYYVAYLLNDYISIKSFILISNKIIKNKYKYLKYNRLINIFCFSIGFLLCLISYRYNIGNVRVLYLSPRTANHFDVINWLQNEYGEINYGKFDSPETKRAIVALSLIKKIDPKINLFKIFDKTLSEINIITRPQEVNINLLKENILILRELYSNFKYSEFKNKADTLNQRLAEIEKQEFANKRWQAIIKNFQDSLVSNEALLNDCDSLYKNYKVYIKQSEVLNFIQKLESAVDDYQDLISKEEFDTLTIIDKLVLCEKFIRFHRRLSPEKTYVLKLMRQIDSLSFNFAFIDNKDKFVTCRKVVNRMCQDTTNGFTVGSVYSWAQIRAPRAEDVRFEWYSNGRSIGTACYSIQPNMIEGYRVWSQKKYGNKERGKNEVRLYNSQNQLIGRRIFYVN